MCIAHDGKLTPWDGVPLRPEHHQFWVRRRGALAWAFEVLLELTDGRDWVYRRDGRVRRPVASIGTTYPDQLPYLRPDLCLFYKSNRHAEQRNADDFDTTLPLLDSAARGLLRETLTLTQAGHPWIVRLP